MCLTKDDADFLVDCLDEVLTTGETDDFVMPVPPPMDLAVDLV